MKSAPDRFRHAPAREITSSTTRRRLRRDMATVTARLLRKLATWAADDPNAGLRAHSPVAEGRTFCVLVVDSARARILVLKTNAAGPAPTTGPLTEVADLPPSGSHHDGARRFAEMVVDAAAHVWRQVPRSTIIVAASPRMLELLRPAIARRRRGASTPEVHELDRNLTSLSGPALHDALADLSLVPPRSSSRTTSSGTVG